uniref:BAG family molecular chaperone regulator 8, chloroplastic n=1 Tax=Noccaea caerulescens TaxID=107243 RepID=A0A1J3HZC8_NOCCA
MASRRHHHACSRLQNHHDYIPLVATSSLCCTYGDSTHCCTQSSHPSPPPDNLLHLVASYLQTQPQQERKCHDQTCSCETPSLRFNGSRRQHDQQKNVPRESDHIVLSCLLRKIDDLESSLNQFAASYDQRRNRYSTLRDSAARVIQTHFRSYLVRRSISFRRLKELAAIKSSFLTLKSSVSGKPHFPFKAVSRKATDLLLQLDSVQGRIDPMIRNSKRSLSRDLVRFLQHVDDCAVKRCDFVAKSAISVCFMGSHSKRRGSDGKKPQGFGVAEDRTTEKLRNRMGKVSVTSSEDEDNNEEPDFMTDDSEEVPVKSVDKRNIGSSKSRTGDSVKGNVAKPPVRKTMVIDRNRNVYQVYGNTHDLTSSADDDSVDDGEEILVMSRDKGRKHSSKTRKGVLVKEGGANNRVVKTVSFDENGNIYKVYGDTPESSITEEDDSTSGSNNGNGEGKGKGNGLCRKVYREMPESSVSEEDDSTDGSNGVKKGNRNEVEDIKHVPKENEGFEEEEEEEEAHSENEVSSSESSEGDAMVTRNANNLGRNEHKKEIQLKTGSLMFSPPLPLKMEP